MGHGTELASHAAVVVRAARIASRYTREVTEPLAEGSDPAPVNPDINLG